MEQMTDPTSAQYHLAVDLSLIIAAKVHCNNGD